MKDSLIKGQEYISCIKKVYVVLISNIPQQWETKFIYILRQIQSTIFLITIVLRTVVLLSPKTYHHYRYYIELNGILGTGLFSLLKKISLVSSLPSTPLMKSQGLSMGWKRRDPILLVE